MRLQARFIQLPLQYDAERLAKEVLQFGEESWLPHPQRFAGNDFLPLISKNGEPENESFAGQMAPTKYLRECPYLIDVLASFGASLGRTRLMRLSGGAEVTPHVDIHYYWRDRMRIHVPIVTQPTVSFHCGGLTVNMAAGECWIFDTFSRHRVLNDAEKKRIHLVADTVGGEGFWNLAAAGRLPERDAPGWVAHPFKPPGATIEQLEFESQNMPVVMTPWEIQGHVDFLFREAQQQHPQFAHVAHIASHFTHVWRALWSTYGESKAGWPRYRKALDEFAEQLRAARANEVKLRNGSDLFATLNAIVIYPGLGEARDDTAGETRPDVAPTATPAAPNIITNPSADPRFDRPVFIVNPPRSGSSLLFETLAQAPNVYTVGGESHAVIEGVRGLGVYAANFESNVLDESHARPEIVAQVRQRFDELLRNRDGAPAPAGRVRMLEKTPKNALRIPFLAKLFPEARFIYLYRDPRQVLSSMMEGWQSGRFVMYRDLPGWEGPWSFLLTPGWRDLIGQPLERVVAGQWASAVNTMLDSLDALPAERWSVARYDALLADPNAEIARLCKAVELDWDRTLGQELPLARHTVSKPSADKWRGREAEIESVLPHIAATLERAAKAAER